MSPNALLQRSLLAANETLYSCFDHSNQKFPYLDNSGTETVAYSGDWALSKVFRDLSRGGEVNVSRLPELGDQPFNEIYYQWGYTMLDNVDGFFDRLKETARECHRNNFNGVAVHTVEKNFAPDYHVIYCATDELLEYAAKNQVSGCEEEDNISRGKWYDSDVYAVYRNCSIVPQSLSEDICDTKKAQVIAATTQAPSPTTEVLLPTTGGPLPTTEVPLPTTEVPLPTTEVPLPTTGGPSPTTGGPSPTTGGPLPTSGGPFTHN